MLGLTLGDTEGLSEGLIDVLGLTDADMLGLIEGLSEGDNDGDSDVLGETDGLTDGLTDALMYGTLPKLPGRVCASTTNRPLMNFVVSSSVAQSIGPAPAY